MMKSESCGVGVGYGRKAVGGVWLGLVGGLMVCGEEKGKLVSVESCSVELGDHGYFGDGEGLMKKTLLEVIQDEL